MFIVKIVPPIEMWWAHETNSGVFRHVFLQFCRIWMICGVCPQHLRMNERKCRRNVSLAPK